MSLSIDKAIELKQTNVDQWCYQSGGRHERDIGANQGSVGKNIETKSQQTRFEKASILDAPFPIYVSSQAFSVAAA